MSPSDSFFPRVVVLRFPTFLSYIPPVFCVFFKDKQWRLNTTPAFKLFLPRLTSTALGRIRIFIILCVLEINIFTCLIFCNCLVVFSHSWRQCICGLSTALMSIMFPKLLKKQACFFLTLSVHYCPLFSCIPFPFIHALYCSGFNTKNI